MQFLLVAFTYTVIDFVVCCFNRWHMQGVFIFKNIPRTDSNIYTFNICPCIIYVTIFYMVYRVSAGKAHIKLSLHN